LRYYLARPPIRAGNGDARIVLDKIQTAGSAGIDQQDLVRYALVGFGMEEKDTNRHLTNLLRRGFVHVREE
jgi:hypothetical protein